MKKIFLILTLVILSFWSLSVFANLQQWDYENEQFNNCPYKSLDWKTCVTQEIYNKQVSEAAKKAEAAKK